jgi:hypothetical protein
MSGTIKINNLQLGDSATATNNFVLRTNVDGSATLARGNVGTTTQDILTVASTGLVTLTNGETITVSKLQSGTAVASTSGTSISFSSIPSWVKRITMMLDGVSTNGTSQKLIRVGTGTVVTTGYKCASSFLAVGSMGTSAFTNGFNFYNLVTAADIVNGSVVFTKLTGNTWTVMGFVGQSGDNLSSYTTGSIVLASALDIISLTTANGTDTFDAGSVNIMWE